MKNFTRVFNFVICFSYLHEVLSENVNKPKVIDLVINADENDIHNLTVRWDLSRKEIFSVQFEALVPWSDKFIEDSHESSILKNVLSSYIGELTAKKKTTALILMLQDFQVAKTELVNFTRFKLDIVCSSKNNKTADKCHKIIENIAHELSSSDILRYFHEIGFSGRILPVDGIVDAPEVTSSGRHTVSAYDELTDVKSTLIPKLEESFNTLDGVEDYSMFDGYDAEKHINVNHVEKISDNEFSVHAYLNEIFDEIGDNFNEKFSSYVESMYDLQPLYDSSRVSVRTFNATLSEFENDTSVWFILKTFDIEVLDTDLNMDESYTVFDEIFEKFNLAEFKARFLDVEGESEAADGDQATIVVEESTEAFDESTYIESTTEDVYDTDGETYDTFEPPNDETAPAQFKRRTDVKKPDMTANSNSNAIKSLDQSLLFLITIILLYLKPMSLHVYLD